MRCMACIERHHYSLKGQTEMSANALPCVFKGLWATGGFKTAQLFLFSTFCKEKMYCMYVCMYVQFQEVGFKAVVMSWT